MKKLISVLTAIVICGITSAQFAGVQRGQQENHYPKVLNLLRAIPFYHSTRL